MGRTKTTIAALACAVALGAPAGAAAQSPTQAAYGADGGVVAQVQQANPHPAPATSQASSASLPFTGLEIGGVVLMAAVLAGTGFALRRASRTQQ